MILKERLLLYPKNAHEVHLRILHFEHTSKEKSRSPTSTNSVYYLLQYRKFKIKKVKNVERTNISIVPLDITYPPRAITINIAKEPKVLATIILRPKAPIKRNRLIDIWCRKKYSRICLRNLKT